MLNLTDKMLQIVLFEIGNDVIKEAGKLMLLHYYIHKNIVSLFGKENFSDNEIKIEEETKHILSFIYGGERYTFLMEDNHFILKNNFNVILFRITLEKFCTHNFLVYKEDDKLIQEYLEANLIKESYKYHKVCSTNTQEVHSVTLKATNPIKNEFKIMYVHPKECKKTSWEKFWDEVRKKDIFLVSSIDFFEQLNEIFTYLEERCSKEYARIKLK